MKKDPRKVELNSEKVSIKYYLETTKLGFFQVSDLIKDRLSYFTVYLFESNMNNFDKFVKNTNRQAKCLVEILETPLKTLGKIENKDTLVMKKK